MTEIAQAREKESTLKVKRVMLPIPEAQTSTLTPFTNPSPSSKVDDAQGSDVPKIEGEKEKKEKAPTSLLPPVLPEDDASTGKNPISDQLFDVMDANGDGKLDAEEYEVGVKTYLQKNDDTPTSKASKSSKPSSKTSCEEEEEEEEGTGKTGLNSSFLDGLVNLQPPSTNLPNVSMALSPSLSPAVHARGLKTPPIRGGFSGMRNPVSDFSPSVGTHPLPERESALTRSTLLSSATAKAIGLGQLNLSVDTSIMDTSISMSPSGHHVQAQDGGSFRSQLEGISSPVEEEERPRRPMLHNMSGGSGALVRVPKDILFQLAHARARETLLKAQVDDLKRKELEKEKAKS